MKWGFFIHTNYPGDRYSQGYIDEILDDLEEESDLAKIPQAFLFLLTHSKKLKKRTARILQERIAELSNIQLEKLDRLFRERTSIDWTYDWSKESPETLLLPTFTDEEKLTILSLCTFHPNGYFREKALNLLAAYSTGEKLPFLILRCNDWVPVVREQARKHVENRIVPEYAEQIVHNLPLIFKLNNGKRDNHSSLFDKVITLLSQMESLPFLDQGTKSDSTQIRFFCYKVMIHSKMVTKKTLVNYLKLEKEPHSRLLLFNEIISDISKDEFNEYYPDLIKDKFPMIRATVLQQFYFFNPTHSKSELEQALFDKNGTIRYTARFLLTKQNITDFSSYYIRKITHNSSDNLRGTLLGIGEVGNKSNVNLILPFLKHQNVGVVKAAIHAIAMLDANNYKNVFIGMLDHEHKGISNEARKSLRNAYYQDDKDTLYHLYLKSQHVQTRYNAAVLLCLLPKWDALPYIIEFYADKKDSDIYTIGKSQLASWMDHFNRSFDTPAKVQIDSIQQALLRFGSDLNIEEIRYIEFCMKGFK